MVSSSRETHRKLLSRSATTLCMHIDVITELAAEAWTCEVKSDDTWLAPGAVTHIL